MAQAGRKIIITSKNASLPPYISQAVSFNNMLFLSGSLGISKDTNKLVEGGAASEATQAIENIKNILEAGNSNLSQVLKTTIYLKDIKDYTAVNEVYFKYFNKDPPARTAFQVAVLPMNASVEIEVIAAVGNVVTSHAKL
ncbi:rutC family protein UK114 isoform X3 [Diabrotica virgifera virgifera]|uniref:RutC family protein UK114 n=1 Tax=Diabrotica virgifera virgifera TaxID=50390 RepID=A0ABM5KRE8_DIAVI|nr:rutC family protein UK114 isoform X3 [Diabrotica virgifera virgifera]